MRVFTDIKNKYGHNSRLRVETEFLYVAKLTQAKFQTKNFTSKICVGPLNTLNTNIFAKTNWPGILLPSYITQMYSHFSKFSSIYIDLKKCS